MTAHAASQTVRRWSGATPAQAYRPSGAVYRPRRPTETPLYPVVQHHLETFLAEAQDSGPMGRGVPRWVERDFRSYLRCGILAHGFARVRCTDCGHDRLLAFSCKGRGVCPSCNARRMAEVAAHLTDAVIPHLPTRQWVLSVPKRLRPFLHQTPEVASAVLAIFLRALRAALRDASPGAPAALRDAQLGAISFPQRFGSSLNPHHHYHVLALDGVVSGGVERGVRLHEATRLDVHDAEALARTVQRRVLRWFARHGFLAPNARLRPIVVSIGRPAADEPPADAEYAESPPSPGPASPSVAPPGPSRELAPTGTTPAKPRARSSRMPSRILWARLLVRIYEVLPLLCPASPPPGALPRPSLTSTSPRPSISPPPTLPRSYLRFAPVSRRDTFSAIRHGVQPARVRVRSVRSP
ncbi:MAG: hypothetical protein EA422_00730 [Gemmatimonadales bacterium]|nr:MAG: hypothetical protein EA422_00730 [Gemmatimonadales bacterium]